MATPMTRHTDLLACLFLVAMFAALLAVAWMAGAP